MRDFTLSAYRSLLEALSGHYSVVPVHEFCAEKVPDRAVALRHDVDRHASNALRCAEIAALIGVNGTFYFRYPHTFRPEIIRAIASCGHEVGYHYEVVSKARGDFERAAKMFAEELAEFRRIGPVTTACMHGAPLSRWDNRALWRIRSLADYGLVAEPYLSVNFDQVAYLSDTGRSWNHAAAAVRDRSPGKAMPRFASTSELIVALGTGALGDRIMITIHPERWNDGYVIWTAGLVAQRAKNVAKRLLVRWRERREGIGVGT